MKILAIALSVLLFATIVFAGDDWLSSTSLPQYPSLNTSSSTTRLMLVTDMDMDMDMDGRSKFVKSILSSIAFILIMKIDAECQ
ncbi:hypothetical protein NPIL_551281 [Nephila pilipes]|uniref:Uncharacterized protein n=1 Tax=Nephila pilipes TaxID=299642 RepID=A0A8X6I2P7_NEPPI|nr:hypothetical protein NPIL_551281 [Nephila pilipes]